MSGPTDARGQRVLTPAVTAAAAFALVAAIVSVVFVSVRGGLQLPVAATGSPGIAIATPGPSVGASPALATPGASPTTAPTSEPTAEPPSATPIATPTPAATGPVDPLLALPPCPGHPGCFEYTVRRGESFTAISDRYGLLLWITRALNPEVTNEAILAIGQTIYLGHDPTARLEPCPDGAPCHLYAVRAGDTLSTIAGRYGLSTAGIVALNPNLDANVIVTGQVIRLPLFQG